jgi:hypothetical protein
MRRLLLAGVLAGLILVPGTARGQLSIGVQGNWGSEFDWGVGGRVTADLSPRRIPIALFGTYDYFWPSSPFGINREYWELNFNAVYSQGVYGPQAQTYVGLGLNVANAKGTNVASGEVEENTSYGLNLIGGSKYKLGRMAPYFELRYTIEGSQQLVLTLGVDLILAGGER